MLSLQHGGPHIHPLLNLLSTENWERRISAQLLMRSRDPSRLAKPYTRLRCSMPWIGILTHVHVHALLAKQRLIMLHYLWPPPSTYNIHAAVGSSCSSFSWKGAEHSAIKLAKACTLMAFLAHNWSHRVPVQRPTLSFVLNSHTFPAYFVGVGLSALWHGEIQNRDAVFGFQSEEHMQTFRWAGTATLPLSAHTNIIHWVLLPVPFDHQNRTHDIVWHC